MTYLINRQLVASTHRDSHGEKLSRETLTVLFGKITPGLPIGLDHEIQTVAPARIIGKYLEETNDGELAIFLDLEIPDEASAKEIRKRGGFSIAFSGPSYQVGDGDAVFDLEFDAIHFDADEIIDAVESTLANDYVYTVTEVRKKSDDIGTIVIAIIASSVTIFASSFLSEAGKATFEKFRSILVKKKPDKNIRFEYRLELELDGKNQTIVIELPQGKGLSAKNVEKIKFIIEKAPSASAEEIPGTFLSDGTYKISLDGS